MLFLSLERYKFCVLQWDAETSSLVTRYSFASFGRVLLVSGKRMNGKLEFLTCLGGF